MGASQGRSLAIVGEEPRPVVRRHRLPRVRLRKGGHRQRPWCRRHPFRRHRVCAGAPLFDARRGRCRETLGHRMSTRRIPVGPRSWPGVGVVQTVVMSFDEIAGIAHRPQGKAQGVVVLTHGAGGSRESPLLVKICDEWARRGWLAVRYNLPYRRRRPKGPPSGFAATDQAGVVEAIGLARTLTKGGVIAGGHSYGGRMTSMAIADGAATVDVLTLFSYPLHPPGKPERARTEHLPRIAGPTVVTHGTDDPFGSLDELRPAAALVAAETEIAEVSGARLDLGSKILDLAALEV